MKQVKTGVIGHYWKLFPLGKIYPSAFGIGQHFPNFGETISNRDLNSSHYLYIITDGSNLACPHTKLISHL